MFFVSLSLPIISTQGMFSLTDLHYEANMANE